MCVRGGGGGGGALVSVRADSREALWSVMFAIRDSDRAFPVGIWCQNDVVSTLMRRNHVASTLIRRHFRSCARWVYCTTQRVRNQLVQKR